MKEVVVMRCVLLALFAVFLPSTHAQEALEIFDGAVKQFDVRQKALKDWQYYQTLTSREYDERGKVVGNGRWTALMRPGAKNPIQYISGSTEGDLTLFDKPAKPDKKEGGKNDTKEENQKQSEKPEHEKADQPDSVVDAVKKYSLRDRYDWTRLPDAKLSGEPVYVIHFAPKQKQPYFDSRETRFFRQLAGTLWVAKDDSTVLKAEAALQAPVNLFWVVARIDKLEFAWEAIPDPISPLLRKSRARSTITLVLPFKTVRQKHWLTVGKYEPRTPEK